MLRPGDTICAPATGKGGAISIIRVSGPDCFSICKKIFFPVDRNADVLSLKGYSIVYGEIKAGDEIIDDVLVSIFRAPHSYTGEDSVEISCHASQYIIQKIMELLINNGATSAYPGEFTQRAFANGKMDLSQAEAVADIISSTSRAAHKIAVNQMRGGFSAEISKLRAELLHFASLIELELDFGEEDVELADRNDLKAIVLKVKTVADKLASSFKTGNAIRNGIPVVIVGKPNSGKSTLLNALLSEDRAIVSEIPGTTRDTIEDTMSIDGIMFRFIDTAGLRETTDVIESLGINRTYEKVKQAAVILLLDEITDAPDEINDRADSIRKLIDEDQRLIVIINKIDKGSSELKELERKIRISESEAKIFISAKNRTGIDELKKIIVDTSIQEKLGSDDVIINNIRHFEALKNVSASLGRVIEGLDNSVPDDLIAIDIRHAMHYLGEITGEITSDEILGNIFKNFCIGK
ncbi:MAG TPA: tRNA uridine-5-carboxymethylaminomethyl(34) synthesis GTPase MnmE [Bacteroidales bacterium]|nr:tRNA uridine-5-carboxymethylaminomethyl(34) synthesis GTPase MnmE [Bacteroidales bacterium]